MQQVEWLILDLNSFFASCEQQAQPHLRGQPVAVVPSLTDSTCVIAASYEAKKYGIHTGTSVADAKKLCPHIHLQVGRHRLYLEYHHAIIKAIEEYLPIENVMSIDEFSCKLMDNEKPVDAAITIAKKIKANIRAKVGECLTSSIGLAPNKFLAKVASDMKKPDGLTVITKSDLPEKLLRLDLSDLCGIGDAMSQRLNNAGIFSIEDLYDASAEELHDIWGGIEGDRFHSMLHGESVYRPQSERRSISHQHVLEPPLRNRDGARKFSRYLLMKAAQRLRSLGFYCKRLSVQVKFTKPGGYWSNDISFGETQSSPDLLAGLEQMWMDVPDGAPLRVTVVLSDFIAAGSHQMDLFAMTRQQKIEENLLGSIDKINKRYGYGTIGFGDLKPDFRHFNGRIAFQKVPSFEEF
jgi:DNA polymerase-4